MKTNINETNLNETTVATVFAPEVVMNCTGRHHGGNCKPVINIDTGERYSSVLDAARALETTPGYVSTTLHSENRVIKGVRLMYAGEAAGQLNPLLDRLSETAELERKAKLYDEMMAKEREQEDRLVKLGDALEDATNEVNAHLDTIKNIEDEIRALKEQLASEKAKTPELIQKQTDARQEYEDFRKYEEYRKNNCFR